MLSPEQYEAIGRLTVGFNDVDYMIECCIISLPDEVEQADVRECLREQVGFERRKKVLVERLNVIMKEFPKLKGRVNSLRALIGAASALSRKRNEHVHGVIFRRVNTQHILARYRGEEKPINAAAIRRLAAETETLFHKFIDEYSHLSEELRQAREARDLEANGLSD
jgi:hypothetical protein